MGYYHQCLLEYYGPIVLVKKFIPIDAPESEILTPRTPYDECVKYIAECYDRAAGLLPDVVGESELGLPTKMAALSYKARLLLYAASPLVNGNPDYIGFNNPDGTPLMSTTYDPEKWKRALDAAAAAIALADEINPDTKKPKYDLYTSADSSLPDDERGRKNYHDTFVEEPWNGAELILAKGAQSGIQALQRYGGPRSIKGNMSKGWKTTLVPTMEAVEMYYTKNGLPLDVDPLTKDEDLYSVAPGDNTARLHRNREPRFYASIGFDRGTFEIDDKILTLQLRGGELHGSTLKETDEYQSCTGYLCQKWIHKSSTYNQSKNSYNYRKYAYPYLRLPELFYNYAEADFEYNGSLSPLSLEYLNRVRKRCGLPRFQDSWALVGGIPSGSELRKVLHQERSIEFLFEGRRFHDLRRWKEAPEVMNKEPRSWNRDGKTQEDFYQVIPTWCRTPAINPLSHAKQQDKEMKKLLCSILVGLAALSVTGCDDDEVKTPDFAVSTAQWTFSQQEGMQRMIVSAPGAWTLTGIPDWMTVTPAEAAGPCEITMTYTTNETGAPRKATLTVTCGNETRTIGVEQETVVPESAAGKGRR